MLRTNLKELLDTYDLEVDFYEIKDFHKHKDDKVVFFVYVLEEGIAVPRCCDYIETYHEMANFDDYNEYYETMLTKAEDVILELLISNDIIDYHDVVYFNDTK